jgi:hypothetical protein
VVALGSAGRRVLETAGLTWAEYARNGFFQLLAVAALTVLVLLVLRGWTRLTPEGTQHRALVVLGEVTVALTLLLVVVAFRRLDLYIATLGLTMLRLFSLLFTVWTGVVLVCLGLSLAGLPAKLAGRSWFGPAAAGAGLVLLLGLNVVNPEALVVGHNRGVAAEIDRYDVEYGAELSDDAVPAALAALPDLEPDARTVLLQRMGCDPEFGPDGDTERGWARWNLARQRADDARAEACARWWNG